MATVIREGLSGKGKTGTSLTSSRLAVPTTRRGPNAAPGRSVGLAGKKQKPRSPEKQIPNYLKPTRSSTPGGLENSPQNHGKKPASSSSDATRRRSFERAPAPQSPKTPVSGANQPAVIRRKSLDSTRSSQAQRQGISPAPLERNRRSSSVCSTMVSSPRGVPSPMARKDVRERQSLSPRPVSIRKSSTATRMQDRGTSLMNKKPPMAASGDRIDYPDIVNIPLTEEDNLDTLVPEEEVAILAKCDYEMPDKIIEMEDKELIDPIQVEPDLKEHQNLDKIESSVVKAGKVSPRNETMEETEDQYSLVEENILESNQHLADRCIDYSASESLASEHKADEQKKEAMEYARETTDKKETEGAENAVGEVKEDKKGAQNDAEKQQKPVQGKRESAVSNDVIEETANRLREQRKNKVRALAGAFETVISLQEAK